MADLFISYASEDRQRAQAVANLLADRGWTVWWDRKILAGQAYDQVIEYELESARCVIVLWSASSVASEWVKSEAAVAAERGVLVPALIENVKPPLEFRRKQIADLIGWTGDPAHPGLQALCAGVAALVEGSSVVSPQPRVGARPPAVAPVLGGTNWLRWVGGLAIFLVACAVYGVWRGAFSFLPAAAQGEGGNPPAVSALRTTLGPPRGLDDPEPLQLGVIRQVTLDRNQTAYFRWDGPAAAHEAVLDVRRADLKTSNIMGSLSFLHSSGEMLTDGAISFNEIDVGSRKSAPLPESTPPAAARNGLIFKLVNAHDKADYWVTVVGSSAQAPAPFYGAIAPQPIILSTGASGKLAPDESAFYICQLPAGDYRVTVDFTNARGEHTNLQGYFAVLGANGGNLLELARFNEIDVTYRKVGRFTQQQPGARIVKVHNFNYGVTYRLIIDPEETEPSHPKERRIKRPR